MKKFKFFLVKTVQWSPSISQEHKTLTIVAKDSFSARDFVLKDYPSWDISMFWLVWP